MKCRKDVIVHLASLTSIPESIKKPLDYFLNNELGMVNVLEFARKNKIKKVIFSSSISAKKPDNPYALTKLHSENWCRLYAKLYDMEIYILRIYNVYGKRGHGVVNIFANQKMMNKRFTIHGSGRQQRDFIHVDDVTKGICKIIEMKTGTRTSINKIAKIIESMPKKSLEELK